MNIIGLGLGVRVHKWKRGWGQVIGWERKGNVIDWDEYTSVL